MPDPSLTAVIKVTTTDPNHLYYVHFLRETEELVAVQEFKTIYTPIMGKPSARNKTVIDTARTKLGKPLGEKQ